MRISRLDLFGFKSFPDRTTFQFGRGVSCVVGPNGSGKSNVVDALRWCIGEQSPRSLRGAEMSDVIFAGSEDRKPVGFAEVQLTLISDGGEPFPGDYAALPEVQVGRRLHRSGASEYLINQNRVRRKDVVELLLDSGIGNNLYSFIEQGQVDKVITASPQERRSVIDEAAGIARYKARRSEAHARLQAAGAQLDRASDVVDEMGRRLKTLERQVVRAAKFRRLRANIRHAEVQLALAKSLSLRTERAGIAGQRASLSSREVEARTALNKASVDIEGRRKELAAVEDAVSSRRERVAELDAQLREQEATRRLHEERRAELTRDATRADEEVQATDEQRATAREVAATVGEELAELGQQRAEVEQRAVAVRERLERARDGAATALEEAEASEAELATLTEERTALQAKRASAEARVEALGERHQHAQAQLAQCLEALKASEHEALAAVEAVVPPTEELARIQASAAVAAEAWASAVAQQQAADDALVEALRAREAAFDAERTSAEEAQRRARAWVDAADGHEQAALEKLERLWRQRAAQAETLATERSNEALVEARQRAEAAAAERLRQADDTVRQATEARDASEQSLAQAQDALAGVRTQQQALANEQAKAEAKLAGARGRLNLDESALEGQPRLVDLVEAEAQPGVLERLGERALRPVVTDAEVLARASNTLEDGSVVAAWYRPDGSMPASGEAAWVPSIRSALHTVASGGGPIAGPGFRVSSEGWVELGDTNSLKAAAEQEQSALAGLQKLNAAAKELEASLKGAEEAVQTARVRRTEAQEALRKAEHAAGEQRQAAHAERAAAEEAALAGTREAGLAAVSALASERDAAMATAAEARTKRMASLRAEVEAALRSLIEHKPDATEDGRIEQFERKASEARAAVASALALRDAERERESQSVAGARAGRACQAGGRARAGSAGGGARGARSRGRAGRSRALTSQGGVGRGFGFPSGCGGEGERRQDHGGATPRERVGSQRRRGAGLTRGLRRRARSCRPPGAACRAQSPVTGGGGADLRRGCVDRQGAGTRSRCARLDCECRASTRRGGGVCGNRHRGARHRVGRPRAVAWAAQAASQRVVAGRRGAQRASGPGGVPHQLGGAARIAVGGCRSGARAHRAANRRSVPAHRRRPVGAARQRWEH